MSINSDSAIIRVLERKMVSTGEEIVRAEEMGNKFPEMAEKMVAKMIELEAKQDDINASLNRILRRYTTTYNRGSYTCTNNFGSFTIMVKD